MKLGETTASRRRIGPLRALDSSGDPVTGEDFSGPGELEISVAGAAYVAALGSIVEIGDGCYYYQATVDDAAVGPWVAIKIDGVCEEFTLREDVSEQLSGIIVGETDTADLHTGPMWFIDDEGNHLEEADVDDATVEVSINGAPWAAAAGELEFVDSGYVDYIADPTEVAEVGWLAIRITGPCEEVVFREDVVDPLDALSDTISPTITIISPTPGVAPGDPGGFPAREAEAKLTPIVLQITDLSPGLGYLAVIVRMYIDDEDENPVEEVVYRRNNFRGNYVKGSSRSTIANGVELSVMRAGGWPTTVVSGRRFIVFAVDAVDSDGNLAA